MSKKKTDGHDSDSDNQQKTKNQGFQFETEARAAHRRQQQPQAQPQPTKIRRKNTTLNSTSPTRRSKSSVAATRDLASTSSTQFEPKPVQPVKTEPKELTLSERLASIGRITSTLDTKQDETNNESVETKK